MTPNARTKPRWASLADILALVLLLLTAWTLVAGGFQLTIGPLQISATSWVRLAMEAAVLLVIRYGLTHPLETSRALRGRFVLAYLVLLVTLACSSTQRRVGDGGDYLAMTLNLSRMQPPAISDAEMGDIGLASDRQFLVYLSHPTIHAVLRIETEAPMSGRLVDLETGDTLQAVTGATRFLTIEVPGPRREAVLILTRDDANSTIVR
jgi:uncharacterized membrane protein